MNFVADESVDAQIVHRVRLDGHDCLSIQEDSPGADDERVLNVAHADQRVLLTGDRDFGELVYRLHRASAGVLLLRLVGLSPGLKADLVSDAIREHGENFPGSFSVLEPGRIRIRTP